ncbi:polycystic kidney disease protein 1-like 2 [Mugil cephalus]|uniref:polycystic kidney disease protein 1-like 2 n=1 Tax=Mugil cephalus TaxID=48193 RepID=UPI001FB8425D|nr:polycystic kidney disease protein 1-like 2 [Mugil cephalus]
MCWAVVHLLMLMTLGCPSGAENETSVSCPERQKAFKGSCFEVVGLRRSFFGAQAWCEERGGHLAFIPDEDTQRFLQRLLDSGEDMWLGLATSSSAYQQETVSSEGPLSWLDGSPVTYSRWVSSPQPDAACGHMLKNSGFQWEATRDCNKPLHFVCQSEFGRSIACADHNTSLRCGLGQVIMIDGGFYGRKNIHYCRARLPPSSSKQQHECGWVDVAESITAHCQGRQICQIGDVMSSLRETCPGLRSYLSVDYHCRDGLTLSVNATAAVLDDVTIRVKWLLHFPQENFSCKLSTGDGRVIYRHSPAGFQSGTNVAYRIQKDGKLLSGLSVARGNVPQNITLNTETVKQLGPGCHRLRLYASNVVTTAQVSTDLQVCILEKIVGLQATMLTERNDCSEPADVALGVSLEQGAPVVLFFFLTGENSSYSETKEMNTRKDIFHIGHPIQGPVEVTLRAWNVFSSLEVDVDTYASCKKDSVVKLNGHYDRFLRLNRKTVRDTSEDDLKETVKNAVDEQKELGLLSGETIGQLINSVANKLNDPSDSSPKDYREELRAMMVRIMTDTINEVPTSTPGEVQVVARGLSAIVEKGAELSLSVQEESSSLFQNLSSSLLHMNISNCEENKNEMYTAASIIVRGVSDIMDYSSTMLSLEKNPFSWNERGNISGLTGALSLTTKDGSSIPVENLSEDIEILLPTPDGEQVNTSVLDLGNYSTTIIDIPSPDTTLVLKMLPSKDPLPFKLFLGYMDYPSETHYAAMTEMPQQGTTQEERYTWILDPKHLKGNTGVHYLVVRPIVGPGIKSINASLSITPITAACKFWNESRLEWSDYGCRVGASTTPSVIQCLCNHLTFFGTSFFVTPNLVDPSRTAELFANFAENPVVVCFVGALFVTYLLVVVWARRKDIQDTAKVKVSVLEDNDPMDEYCYLLIVSTGHRIGASTSSQVAVTLLGAEGISEPHHLTDKDKCVFERGAVDMFLLSTPFSLGDLEGIRLWHNNSGSHPAWYVGNIMVQDLQTEQKWHFLCNSWLAIDMSDGSIDKVFPVSTEMDLKRFSNLFFTKTIKDFNDGHLWYSVISRPAGSSFTCVQRVSCCFSLLLCTMLTSIMFYGIPTDPSEQTLDLGAFEFTWQQFMIGVQSSLIMFPVNILIVSIFRNTRPRETSCCRRKLKQPDPLEQESVLHTVSSQISTTNMNANATLDIIIKDITRIACTLSKTVKSNLPCSESEFGPGQQNDIKAILSVLEDFIKQNNKISDNAQSKTQPQLPERSACVHPVSTEEGAQKNNNKTHYLYRQLCHIDRELSLLGPSAFPTPQSYSQALQQVQGMKELLEDKLFASNSVNKNELTHKKSGSADNSDGSQKKGACCHGGLPWWFIFVGWLLVITTSVVSGYFTMLYGLKFGKERSISWLVSTIVSFFQSLLLIQPLKVVFLAIFFALVIKKVDVDDFQNVAIVRTNRNLGEEYIPLSYIFFLFIVRDGGIYAPPPAAHIEKMKRDKILERKAFALIWEILIYMGFMWMLLLVAYGQRDPNAFFLNQHIRDSFSAEISDSMSLNDVFTWANTSLLSNLFGVYPGFITDGNSKLVGNARLRQVRVQRDSCQTADAMREFVADCHAAYSWEMEDMGSYEPGWDGTVGDNVSMNASSPWKYQTQAQLRAYPIWGKMVLYRGGGFVVELGPDLQSASSTLEYLFWNKWLDVYTRAIFVEFTVYNANVNLFCIVTLMLETTAVGAFQFHSELHSIRLYHSTGGLLIFVMTAEVVYLLFILYYMFRQGKLMKQQRWAYFKNQWNLLDLIIILLSWSAVAVFTKRTLLGNRDMTYYQLHRDHFPSFHETAVADSTLQYLIAFLVLLSTVKLWHLLRLNPKMNMITAALQRGWNDISSYIGILMIMFVAYSIACNLIYGWKISSYKTLSDALVTMISLQIGIFNYDEVLNSSPLLGGFIIGTCVMFMTFVVLNLFLTVILTAFSQEQIHHKPSEEEEIVDVMLKKIFSLFGIRYKVKEDAPGPETSEVQ